MSYYKVPIPDECPDCKRKLILDTIGLDAGWKLAANYHCPKCHQSGGQEYDICELIAWCREQDGVMLS